MVNALLFKNFGMTVEAGSDLNALGELPGRRSIHVFEEIRNLTFEAVAETDKTIDHQHSESGEYADDEAGSDELVVEGINSGVTNTNPSSENGDEDELTPQKEIDMLLQSIYSSTKAIAKHIVWVTHTRTTPDDMKKSKIMSETEQFRTDQVDSLFKLWKIAIKPDRNIFYALLSRRFIASDKILGYVLPDLFSSENVSNNDNSILGVIVANCVRDYMSYEFR